MEFYATGVGAISVCVHGYILLTDLLRQHPILLMLQEGHHPPNNSTIPLPKIDTEAGKLISKRAASYIYIITIILYPASLPQDFILTFVWKFPIRSDRSSSGISIQCYWDFLSLCFHEGNSWITNHLISYLRVPHSHLWNR